MNMQNYDFFNMVYRIDIKIFLLGEVPLSQTLLGLKIYVSGAKDETTTDLKKQGLYTDLNNSLELKIGDTLVFYLSRGD